MTGAQVTEEQNIIVSYIKNHMFDWLEEKNIIPFPQKQNDLNTEILRRLDRIEIQISHQNEKFELVLGQMDKRFEQVDKRFEQVDKRFEQVDKRFEEMQHSMDKRFEQVDKRFEDMQQSMDKRFEQVNKRFTQMFWFGSIGFIALGTMMSIYQFLG